MAPKDQIHMKVIDEQSSQKRELLNQIKNIYESLWLKLYLTVKYYNLSRRLGTKEDCLDANHY